MNMKIAMIGHKQVPSRSGGIEVVVTELSSRMAARGHRVYCYNRWDSFFAGQHEKQREYRGVRLLYVPTFKRSSLNAVVYSFLATVRAVFGRYDVIHLHAEGPASMALMTHLFRIPTVVTIHGLDWQRAKWGGFATRFLLFGEKMAAKYADQIIVLSKSAQDYFKQKYHRETLFIPNGISAPVYAPPDEIKTRWGLEKNSYVLFLARLVPEKGLHYLIEAFGKVKTDKRLVIAGKIDKDDAYVNRICDLAQKDERIIMTDFVQGRVLNELMSNNAVYVLPSETEGMAMSLLEALSYGCRCLLSDIPENKEAAASCARYFKSADVDDLRGALQQMLDQEQDEKAREACASYARARFDWEEITEQTLEAYQTGRKTLKKKNAVTHSKDQKNEGRNI